MVSKAGQQQRRHERRRRAAIANLAAEWNAAARVEAAEKSTAARVRPTELDCLWCGRRYPVKPAGRIPKWCSPACRQRGWEQQRAAESGQSAVQLVERVVLAKLPPARKLSPAEVQQHADGWVEALAELQEHVEAGYVDQAVNDVAAALDQTRAAITARKAWNSPDAVLDRKIAAAEDNELARTARVVARGLQEQLPDHDDQPPEETRPLDWWPYLLRFGRTLRDTEVTADEAVRIQVLVGRLAKLAGQRTKDRSTGHFRGKVSRRLGTPVSDFGSIQSLQHGVIGM